MSIDSRVRVNVTFLPTVGWGLSCAWLGQIPIVRALLRGILGCFGKPDWIVFSRIENIGFTEFWFGILRKFLLYHE